MNDITENIYEINSAVLSLIGIDPTQRRITQCEITIDALRPPIVRLEEITSDEPYATTSEDFIYEVADKDAFNLAVVKLLGLEESHVKDLRLLLRARSIPTATVNCNFYKAVPQSEVFALKEI